LCGYQTAQEVYCTLTTGLVTIIRTNRNPRQNIGRRSPVPVPDVGGPSHGGNGNGEGKWREPHFPVRDDEHKAEGCTYPEGSKTMLGIIFTVLKMERLTPLSSW
jgi:hypothetical protein